jgi:carbon-monoxide dehydrogenase medium subunit
VDLQGREELGVLQRAASLIADQQVRNRGTVGGSIVHGDSAADLPAVMLAAEAELTVQGSRGQRTLAAADMFQDYLTTAVGPGEVLIEVRVPSLDGWSWGYQKFNRRSEDWAMVGVCALVKKSGDGVCESA